MISSNKTHKLWFFKTFKYTVKRVNLTLFRGLLKGINPTTAASMNLYQGELKHMGHTENIEVNER